MKAAPPLLSESQTTIDSYEGFADQYADLGGPSDDVQSTLTRFVESVGPGASVLEIGSGPGYEADFLEALGVSVRRTDATHRFLEIQADRGKSGDLLNVITDQLGGPYDGIVALCVLIHVPRPQIDDVLHKCLHALRPGGTMLISMRDGDGETGGKYHTIYWRRDAFVGRLESTGFALVWDEPSIDCDNDRWTTYLARRPA